QIVLFDTQSQTPLRTWQAHNGGLKTLAWSPDKRRLLSSGTEGAVFVWDSENGQKLAQLLSSPLVEAAYWPSPSTILTVPLSWKDVLQVWDAETYQFLEEVDAVSTNTIRLSPDEQQLAIASTGSLYL